MGATPRDPGAALPNLDDAVQSALTAVQSAGTPAPDVVIFAATGSDRLVRALEDLEGGVKLALAQVDGTPEGFRQRSLYAGPVGPTSAWIIDDAPGPGTPDPRHWARAFPVWLAAAAGAKFMIHTSAGTAISDDPKVTAPGAVVRATDHINLSGTTPLLGLGASRLGPLFPDQTRVHDGELGEITRRRAEAMGIDLREAVAACTLGPALSTPAEFLSYRAAGAGFAVQRLADPLIAAAHAGLGALALTALTAELGETVPMVDLVERASRVAPELDRLVLAVTESLGPLVAARREELVE